MNRIPLLIELALRNLVRQKRRNLLLGTAMAIGMAVLVLAHSFSHGISDTLFNKIIVYVAGHINVSVMENGRFRNPIMRDKPRMEAIIEKNVKGLIKTEDMLNLMCRGVGNGKSDFLVVVGVSIDPKSKDTLNYFPLLQGRYADYQSDRYTNPVLITESKARSLGVTLFDGIRIRFGTVYGQQETAQLTVVGILKQKNAYMDMAVYLNKSAIKKLLGLRPQESGALQIIIKNPKEQAIDQADYLHKALIPNMALIKATWGNKNSESLWVMPFRRYKKDISSLEKNLNISGDIEKALGKDGVLISEFLATDKKLNIGSPLVLVYPQKFAPERVTLNYKVTGLYKAIEPWQNKAILVADQLFYKTYYRSLPPDIMKQEPVPRQIQNSPISSSIGREWELLPRSKTTKEFIKRMKGLMNEKSNIAFVDVETMYESASAIIKMESVLNIITLFAVLILFLIILMGVVNTLRMTIRERTHEIGTMRAIGMQSKDIRSVFLLETFFLSIMSSVAGILLGLCLMGLLGMLTFDTAGALSILLVDRHLHFVPVLAAIAGNMVFIIFIAQITAWFPARRAAKRPVAEALRHYE